MIVFGTNISELEAGSILGSKFTNACTKTVEFKKSPSPQELVKQIKLIIDQFEFICYSA